jgi:hypothetical protein
MKKGTSKRLTPEQRAELKSLAALPDDAIDTSDAPELLDRSGGGRARPCLSTVLVGSMAPKSYCIVQNRKQARSERFELQY